ncbi:M64 family metallopeptidase [Myroides pelagicus]|uniref:Peptidase M64 n=1 Tax=Myroides pelagicus TaxID=270914 RepID=A0A7K1GKD7_9FLAO|nr:M64 family metallopeptidase [Myroides pelagicus]MEC4114271.1 M64 family metallopeptidase [Myroides pelagicus]MTH29321.1 peptidase M64 [Myroides pelagicus]
MNKLFTLVTLFCVCLLQAQDFNQYFEQKTLRLDYIFGGNLEDQYILLDEVSSYPQWAGRIHNLDKNALKGNGQVRIYDAKSETLIYTNSFSTLFQEWLSTEEATKATKSFENVFLVPFPKEKVTIELVLFDMNGKEKTKLVQYVDPSDILIHKKGEHDVTKHEYVHKAEDDSKAINVVFVAEGFKEGEMDKFMEAVHVSVEQLFAHDPFSQFSANFNFIAVQSPSIDSGVSVPREGDWKKTAVESNFDTFYSQRYLTTNRIKKLHDILAGIPYEHIIILANTDVYGGGGIYNSYTLTTTGHKDFKPVVVHEFGHSFAGLGDEYFYPNDVLSDLISNASEPWEQNITTLVDFDSKWKKMLKKGTPIPTSTKDAKKYSVGVYEGLEGNRIYKGALDCRMKTNQYSEFCPVCQNAIKELIEFYTK